jgi:hypothetical protein
MDRKPLIEVYAPRPRVGADGRAIDLTFMPDRAAAPGGGTPLPPTGGSGVQFPPAEPTKSSSAKD